MPLVASGVILIHMVRRRERKQRIYGPAFLVAEEPPTIRPSRQITDWWQMIFRLAAGCAAILALAGPYKIEKTATGSVQAVMIDASLSMMQPSAQGPSRLQRAESRARKLGATGAPVFYCSDHLVGALTVVLPGRADLRRCWRDLNGRGIRKGVWLITDGQGDEQFSHEDMSEISIELLPTEKPPERTYGVTLREENERWMLTNGIPFVVQVGQKKGRTCQSGEKCVVGGRNHPPFLSLQVAFGGRNLSWKLPFEGARLQVQFVADYVSRDPFGAARLWQESLAALARQKKIHFSVVRDPATKNDSDLIIYLWEQREQKRWGPWLARRPAHTTLWIVPGPLLPDSIVPQPIVGAFGSYRGWLHEPHSLVLRQGTAAAVTHTIGRLISVAETDRAQVVLRDQEQQPLLLFLSRPKATLLWLFSPIDKGHGIALTPDFVPFVSGLLDKYVLTNSKSNTCIAGLGRCPYGSDGRIFPQPDWRELTGRYWMTRTEPRQQELSQKITMAPWFIFAALLLCGLAIPPWGTLLVLSVLVANPLLADPLVVAIPGDSHGQVIDQARQDAFYQLSRQLALRGNIQLAYPVPLTRDVRPAFMWSHFCGQSIEVVKKSIAAAKPWLNRQVPWWVEDCSPPGEPSPGWLQLHDLAGASLAGGSWQRIPANHVLFRSYYLLNKISGRFRGGAEKAMIDGGMPLILYTPQDLTGKVAFDGLREDLIRSYVNVVFYLMMGNYKDDGIHVPYLLKRLKRLDRR